MIRFSGIEVVDHVPGAILYTNHNAGVHDRRYVPEVVATSPVFKPGQIVQVVQSGFVRSGWYGIVIETTPDTTKVEFGKHREGSALSHFTFSQAGYALKIIHEVE